MFNHICSAWNIPLYELKLVFLLGLIIFICLFSIYIQYYRQNKTLPIFDPGCLLIIFTSIYVAYPIFSYVMSGFTWSDISDRRLWDYNIFPEVFYKFMLLPFYYLLALFLSYIVFTNYKLSVIKTLKYSKKNDLFEITLVSVLFIFIKLTFFVVNKFGIEYNHHIWFQMRNFFSAISYTLLLYIIVFLFKNWHLVISKLLLSLLLFMQGYYTFIAGYGRTSFFLIVISMIIGFHLIVKKINIRSALIISISLFWAFLLKGFLTTGSIYSFGKYSPFSAANEFTILIGTAYDIYSRIKIGLIDFIPLQAYFNDFILLIPSQLLPFPKLDLSQWYLSTVNLQGTGVGMMFGVVAQGVIGYGIAELIIRGTLLGLAMSYIYVWFYSKKEVSIWQIVFMIFVATKSYYTYRAGTGYLLYFVIYHFYGTYFIVKLIYNSLKSAKSLPSLITFLKNRS